MRFISASSLASPFAFLFLESSNLLYPIPMATDLETRAKEAFIDNHFGLAVDLYSQTIAMNPKNAKLFADRAQLEEYQTAKAALETCVSLAPGDSRFSNLIKECEVCIAAGELPVQSVDEAPTDVMIPPASQPLDKTASQSLDERDVASNDA